MRLAFDIEANGFLETVSRIHCMVLIDVDTDEEFRFRPNEVEDGVRMLYEADLIIGQNIIKYDIPVIQKLFPWFDIPRSKVQDTLVLSRLVFTDLSDSDFNTKGLKFPNGKLIGSHSLEAWGYRLGYNKLDYQGGWDEFTEEMLAYNAVDTAVTVRLWRHILKQDVDPRANELEHEVAFIVAQQERYGFAFDVAKAERLAADLQSKLANLESKLQDVFPPFYLPNGQVVTPKRTTNGTKIPGTWAGAKYQKIKKTVFNPGSRNHVALMLKRRYQWEPVEFTPSGAPKVDEKVLSKLPWPEAKLLSEYFTSSKVLGYLIGKDEDKGWLNIYQMVDGEARVFGECITNGAVTGRGTHKKIANIPRVSSPYGRECRELFTASKKRKQLGADASGLELRMLAHFLAKYDGGAYGRAVVEGDVHWSNTCALGLASGARCEDEESPFYKFHNILRNGAKTFIYAFLYGAGDLKIGQTLFDIMLKVKQAGYDHAFIAKTFFNGSEKPGERALRKAGKIAKATFIKRTPGLDKLIKAVKETCEKQGYLKGLDGRRLRIRKTHAALNTLLQSAGSLVCKRWMVEVDHELTRRHWHNIVQQLIWYHDELQFDVVPEYVEDFKAMVVEMIPRAGEFFKMRVPLAGEAKVGNNWAECH
jgi:DNA polymerase I-like protein with 3'-5' exonuclease and polymerase domains